MAVETKEYRAEARFQRVSPQKARLVLDLIKGRGVQEALETARFTKKRIAPVIHKLLTSAVDNAKYVSGEHGVDLDVDNQRERLVHVLKRGLYLSDDGVRLLVSRIAGIGKAQNYQKCNGNRGHGRTERWHGNSCSGTRSWRNNVRHCIRRIEPVASGVNEMSLAYVRRMKNSFWTMPGRW